MGSSKLYGYLCGSYESLSQKPQGSSGFRKMRWLSLGWDYALVAAQSLSTNHYHAKMSADSTPLCPPRGGLQLGEEMYLVGSADELGAWDLSRKALLKMGRAGPDNSWILWPIFHFESGFYEFSLNWYWTIHSSTRTRKGDHMFPYFRRRHFLGGLSGK